MVASFAAGVRELALDRMTALHTAVLIATFGRDTPARCGAFVDERRIVAGDACGRQTLIQFHRAVRLRRHYALQSVERPQMRRGFRRSIRLARLERELSTGFSHWRAHRHLPLRYARTLRRVRR